MGQFDRRKISTVVETLEVKRQRNYEWITFRIAADAKVAFPIAQPAW